MAALRPMSDWLSTAPPAAELLAFLWFYLQRTKRKKIPGYVCNSKDRKKGDKPKATPPSPPPLDIGPLINLGMQHDGRSARTWMKRVFTIFVLLWEGEKDLLESTKMDFYET